jgi:zinc/manganese transport system substrate-binding protein
LFILVLALGEAASAEQPLKVVTTLSTFADLVRQVGGDLVEVSYVASPRFNPHFIEPRPSDVLKVKRANLFVHAGLDLEFWRGPLLDAAGNPDLFQGQKGELDLSKGIPLLEVPDKPVTRLMGDIHIYGNPHYWTSPDNGAIMARAIAAKLSELGPDHAAFYHERLSTFLKRLEEKKAIWQEKLKPIRGKKAIAYHRSWPYLAKFAGITIEQFAEPQPGIPPTPKQLADLERYIAKHHVQAILQETFVPRAASGHLARRTGVKVVTLCQNVGEIPEASDYIALIDYNVRQLAQALRESNG